MLASGRVDPVLAGALGVAGLAGWLPVSVRAPVEEGETVLVLGATGTVGLVAIQGARLLGAGRVVAAGRRPEALERARRLGADAVVSLDEEDLAEAFGRPAAARGPRSWSTRSGASPSSPRRRAAPRRADRQHRPVGGAAAPFLSADVRGKQLNVLGFSNFGTPRRSCTASTCGCWSTRGRARSRWRSRPSRSTARRRRGSVRPRAGVKVVVTFRGAIGSI